MLETYGTVRLRLTHGTTMWKLSNPLRAGFGLALGVILVATGFSYWNTRRLFEQTKWVAHTHSVRAQLAGLLAHIQDAETFQRGFLLTGDEGFLKRFDSALQSIPDNVGRLKTLVADNEEQLSRLAELQSHIDERLARLRNGIVLRQREGLEAARQYVMDGTGTRAMEAVRTGVSGMEAVEERLLHERSTDANRAARTAALTFAVAAVLATVFIALLYALLRRFVAARLRVEGEREELLGLEQTARIAAEDAEKRSRDLVEFNQAVMTNMSEGLYTVNPRGLVTFLNPEAERLFGWSAAELIGRKMHDATHYRHPDGRPFPAEECPGLQVLKTGVVLYEQEDVFIRKDGTFFPVVYSSAPVVSGGGVRGLVVVFRDITQQKAADAEREQLLRRAEQARAAAEMAAEAEHAAREAAESASRTKDAFLATVSHELRTPLSPILTWTRILQAPDVPPERYTQGLEVIDRCARTEAQLVEDLLDVSRIVAGKMRMDVRAVSIVSVIESALDVIRPAADAKGIRLQTVLDSEVGHVLGDAERLQQVLWNLLSNAVKFTPKGGRIQVALQRVNSHVEISVSDTGKGIRPDFLGLVFDRFQQEDRTSKRAHGGLGLGLAIVRHIVEAHGGSVRVASEGLGKGAVFTVELPLMVARAESNGDRRHPTAQEPARAAQLPRLDGLRVLVVDDEPDASESVEQLLNSCGAETRAAGSAEQARWMLQRWIPDVLLSDIGMPGEDGYTFIAKLREMDDEEARIPAVALTAYASRDDKVRLLSSGFQAHVPKPLDPPELIAVIASLARSAGKL